MKTKTDTLRGAVVRSALAVALALSMVPAQAFTHIDQASATETGASANQTAAAERSDRPEIISESVNLAQSSSAQAGESAQPNGAASGAEAEAEAPAADASGADAVADASADNADDASGAASQATQQNPGQQNADQPAASADAVDRADILNTQVQLNGQSADAHIAYNGLVYTVNADAPETVALTGWTGTAPKGALSVPAQIVSGTNTYKVTKIRSLGGGFAASEPSGVTKSGTTNSNAANAEAAASDPSDSAGSSDGADSESSDDSDLANGNAAASINPYTTDVYTADQKATGVTSITLPATLESADVAFFQLFPNAASISVDSGNAHLASYNGALYSADLTHLLLVPEGMEGSAVLPVSLASVPACVFTRCTKLLAIDFPAGSTNETFAALNGILYTSDMSTLLAAPAGLGSSATLAPNTAHIAEGAFWGNAALRTIVAQSDVADIVVNPTFDPAALAAAAMADQPTGHLDTDVPVFDPAVIEGATVVLSDSCARGAWEAAGFTRFEAPAQAGDQIQPAQGSGFAFQLLDDHTLAVRWEGGANNEAAPAAVQVPDYGILNGVRYQVSTVAEGAFAGQTGIVTVDLPASVTTVGARAFDGCTALKTIHLPNAVSQLGDRALANTALLSLVLPTGLSEIGAQALAGLQGTTVVALHNVAAVADDALEGATGVNLYVPAAESSEWRAGLPAAGNHIYMYGVQLGSETLELAPGETVPLFSEDALQAPGEVQVEYAYKAKSLSISEDGTVEGKQAGASQVTATLTLPIQEVVVKGISSNEVRLEKASVRTLADTGAEVDTIAITTPLTLASANQGISVAATTASPRYNIDPEVGCEGVSIHTNFPVYGEGDGDARTDTEFYIRADEGFYFSRNISGGALYFDGTISGSTGTPFVSLTYDTSRYEYYMATYTVVDISDNHVIESGELFENQEYLPVSDTYVDSVCSYDVYIELKEIPQKKITINRGTGVNTITQSKTTYTPSTSSQTFTVTATALTGYNASRLTLTQATGTTDLSFSSQGTSSTVTVTIPANKSVDLTLTASLAAKTSALTFNINGGSGTVPTGKIATYGQAMPSISGTFTRDGYTFGGWWDTSDSSGGTQYYTSSNASARTWNKNVTTGTTLYARWTLNTYTLSWNPDGGHWSDNSTTVKTSDHEYGSTVSGWNGSTIPEKTGYTFDGWYDHPDYEVNFEKSFTVTKAGYYYAGWAANYYTVSFNANYGSGGTHPNVSVAYGSSVKKPTGYKAPTRAGYTLMGWYDTSDSSGGNKYMNADGTTTGCKSWDKTSNGTLYARWNANTITLTWKTDTSTTFTTTTQTYAASSKVILPTTTPKKDNYDFAGWYTAATGGTQVTGNTALPTTNTTYYAHWTPAMHAVEVDANGGVWADGSDFMTLSYAHGDTIKGSDIEAPTREGYRFTGCWYWRNFTNTQSGFWEPMFDHLTVTDDLVLEADWVQDTADYKVEFYYENVNGEYNKAVNETLTLTGTIGETVSYTPPAPPYDDMWLDTDKSTLSGVVQADGSLVLKVYYTLWGGNLLYMWGSDVVPSGVALPSDPTWYRSGQRVKLADKPSKPGYTFEGWKVTHYAYGTLLVDDNGYFTMVDDDVVVTGTWTANTITIKWNDGNKTWKTTTQKYSETAKVEMPAASAGSPGYYPPSQTGYIGDGWYTEPEGKGSEVTSGTALPASDTIYYVKWFAIQYLISYNGNGATSGNMDEESKPMWDYDKEVTLAKNKYQKEGHTFQGWALSSGATEPDFQDEEVVINLSDKDCDTVVLYAVWKANTYTVKFDGGEGATGSTADQKLTYGTAANLTKNGFEKEGHTFQGWTTTQGGTKVEYADGASVLNLTAESDGTVTLYAVWEVNTYKTTWDPNGGYWGDNEDDTRILEMSVQYGLKVWGASFEGEDIIDPSRGPGFIFQGWTDKKTHETYEFDDGFIEITENRDFEAEWSTVSYDIAFDGNGATSGDMPVSKLWIYNDPPCPLPKNQYERTGYTFLGWALSPDATEPDYLDEEEVTALTTEDGATVTLYAVWKENEEASYTIEHYYQNTDGDFEKTEQTVPATTGEEVALEPKPTATHYVLDDDARNVLTGTVKSDNSLTLTVYYLRWDCSVSYKWGSDVVPEGAELPSDDTTHLVGQTITVADTLTADGYTFSGWRGTYAEFDGTEMSGNELTVSVGEDRTFTMPNTDVTFTGTWTANDAKIVFEVNGGEKLAEINLTGKTGETLASTDLPTEEQVKKVGWYLAGWYDNAELAGNPIEALPETFPAGTTTYYAKWSPVMSVTAPVSLTLGLTKSSDGVEGIPVTASFVSHTPVDGELSLEAGLSTDNDEDGGTYADRLQNVRDFFTGSADNVAVQFADASDATQTGRVPLSGASQGTGLDGLIIKPTETRGVIYSLDLDQVDARDVEIPDGDQAKSIALLRFVFALTE